MILDTLILFVAIPLMGAGLWLLWHSTNGGTHDDLPVARAGVRDPARLHRRCPAREPLDDWAAHVLAAGGMSEDVRTVPVSAEQAAILEELGVVLMRRDDDRAMKVLAVSLAYKFSPPLAAPLPDNVVHLEGYSRRAPCA